MVRESQIGTVNYMSPEAIKCNMDGSGNTRLKIGPASDVWSLGCIFYLMVYGKTPFQHLSVLQKLQRIPDSSCEIEFRAVKNKALLDLVQRCLQRDPRNRPTIAQLLEHDFLHPETRFKVSWRSSAIRIVGRESGTRSQSAGVASPLGGWG